MIRLLLLLSVCAGLMGQISSIPGATPGGGSGAPNVTASSTVAVTSLTMNISSLNLSSLDTLIVQCWSGASAPLSPVTITSINPASTTSITINFASTANVVCRANSNGGAGPQGVPGATGPAGANGTNGTNGAISQIQDEGSGLPVQPIIDFVGAGVTATNGVGKTIVTIPGGPGGGNYQTVQSAGVAQPAQPTLNILASTGGVAACVDDAANNRTNCSFGADTSVLLSQATAQAGAPWLCTGTGTAGAQTCNMTPALGAYTTGQVIQYRPGTTNTTTQTIAINGLAAVSILRHDGTALQAGDLTSGRQYPITYDGTAFRLSPAGTAVSITSPYLALGGVNYLPSGGGFFAASVPPASGWTGQNFATATFTTSGLGGALNILTDLTTSPRWQTRQIGSNRTLVAKLATSSWAVDGSGRTFACGISLNRPSGSGVAITMFNATYDWRAASVRNWTIATASTLSGGNRGFTVASEPLLRIRITGGNVLQDFSGDGGLTWTNVTAGTETAVLGGPVAATDLWGIVATGNVDAGTSCTLLHWQES